MKQFFLKGIVCALLSWAGVAGAQSIDQAIRSADADLKAALEELSSLNDQIAREKIPLARKLSELEDEVLAKRREHERALRVRDSQSVDLNTLRSAVKAQRDENSYLSSLLDEYIRNFETRMHISEVQRYEKTVEAARLAPEDVNLSEAEKFARQIEAVKTALQRIENLMGGETFEGRALMQDGKVEQGSFAVVGPVVLFASEQSPAAGIARLEAGSNEAVVTGMGQEYVSDIRQITTSGTGDLPLDPTLGNAFKIASTDEPFIEHVKKGGVVMVPILLIALVAILVSIVKWIEISRVRVPGPLDLQVILDQLNAGKRDEAMARAGGIKGPAGRMLEAGVRHAGEKKELIEEVLYEQMLHTRPRLERLLPLIALTAATAPLLGLLGTVTGMIHTFKMITIFGTSDPKMLSSGISEALITTEFGLIVAIPALLAHAILSRRTKGVLAGLERTAVGFINGLKGKS